MSTYVETRPRADRLAPLRGGHIYVWLTLFSLAVAAISLAYPSTPSYDPWSWLIWGRQIEHGHLIIAGGSSWKPLPVIFTTVFALFGSAQPNLWLLIARTGAVLSVLMTGRLTARLTWQLTLRYRHPAGTPGQADHDASALHGGRPERSVLMLPALLAALAAMFCSSFTKAFPGDMLLGYSEGVAAAAVLIAAERAWDGHHRQAFAIGILAALDRPETWIVWGPYGLWVMWRDRRSWPLVTGLGVLMLLLWVIPQKLGGGTTKALVTHAQHNHAATSAVNSSFPFWHELAYVVWPLTIERVEIAALIEMALTVVLIVRSRRAAGGWGAAARRYEPAVVAALLSLFGLCWWLLISVETQAGFAGNPRYAVFGVFTIYIGGCAAFGWAAVGIARLIATGLSRLSARRGLRAEAETGTGWRRDWRPHLVIGSVIMALIFVFVPNMFDHRFNSISSIRYSLRYQAQLRQRIRSLIADAGGAKKVESCGSMMANNLQVTMVAWYLDVPIGYVQALPRKLTKVKPGPNVIFQNPTTTGKIPQPTPRQISAWEQGWLQHNGSKYTVTHYDTVTLYMNCSAYSRT
jgi:hypothetical protein